MLFRSLSSARIFLHLTCRHRLLHSDILLIGLSRVLQKTILLHLQVRHLLLSHIRCLILIAEKKRAQLARNLLEDLLRLLQVIVCIMVIGEMRNRGRLIPLVV